VELVELKKEPIVRITETGIELPDRSMDFDIIILATGFDALTGCWDKIDIKGRNGSRLKGLWANGAMTYLGSVCQGFPNLILVGGPHAAHGNVFRSTQHHADWATDLLKYMRLNDIRTVDVGREAMEHWVQHVQDCAKPLLAYLQDNYASGANVPGKPRSYLLYHAATAGAYRLKLEEKAKGGYPELIFEKERDAKPGATTA
jgi:hypothetical protein